MKKTWHLFALLILLVVSLACQGGATATPTEVDYVRVPGGTEGAINVVNTEFPLPENITNLTDIGNGAVNFQTELKIQDAITFYRVEFTEDGYTEREINTTITETTFNLVFEDPANEKTVVVQGVDLGGRTSISIRLEDV